MMRLAHGLKNHDNKDFFKHLKEDHFNHYESACGDVMFRSNDIGAVEFHNNSSSQ